jgi:hypothetical protein
MMKNLPGHAFGWISRLPRPKTTKEGPHMVELFKGL